jgi:hypothetical protein
MTATATAKPTNKAQLERYLKDHPHLKFFHPGGVSAAKGPTLKPRKFLKMTAKRFVFETEDGTQSTLDAPGKGMEFFGDRFEVIYGPEWGDLAGRRMVYTYMDEPYVFDPAHLKPTPTGEKPTTPPTTFAELLRWLQHHPVLHCHGYESSGIQPGPANVTFVDMDGWFWLTIGTRETKMRETDSMAFTFDATGFTTSPAKWDRETPKPTARFDYRM